MTLADMPKELTARVHLEDGTYWAEVVELPGCFASGLTLDELREALEEAIVLFGRAGDEDETSRSAGAESPTLQIDELRLAMA